MTQLVNSGNSTFEDEPADFLLLDGVAHDEYSIEFTEVPDWMESLLNRICAECDTVTYDGNLLTMSSDSFERNKVNPNSPLTSLSCTMRPANNYPAIDLDGGGQNSGGLLVTYGIKTRAFTALDAPNADQTDNIVQITEVN